MEESIDQIEHFLRGQMNLKEEATFKASLVADGKHPIKYRY